MFEEPSYSGVVTSQDKYVVRSREDLKRLVIVPVDMDIEVSQCFVFLCVSYCFIFKVIQEWGSSDFYRIDQTIGVIKGTAND